MLGAGATPVCSVMLYPRPPNVALSRALWSPLDGIWGLLKGSWGVLDVGSACFFQRA